LGVAQIFPQHAPEVCVVLISCDSATLDTLSGVYARALAYLGRSLGSGGEPLRYEVVWFDGGSSEGDY
jgi:hypothetical protein